MSKRVVLGKFGTSSGEFGLRVSKPTTDAVNTDGTAVSINNLLFDSITSVISPSSITVKHPINL